ncbi:MAG: GTP cyclohydrolase FolE2 [Leptonema sp. (in: bacteria)]
MARIHNVDFMQKINKNKNHFPIKDKEGLSDFQKLPDHSGIDIPEVGITNYRIPILFPHSELQENFVLSHDAIVSMRVNLKSGKTGINMSRLCSILQEESLKNVFSHSLILKILKRFQLEMRDEDSEEIYESAYINIQFLYPMKQPSLKSNLWGWQYYPVLFEGRLFKDNFRIFYTLEYEYSSTCPCSLSLAHQYEYEYAQGLTNEGVGIATAHAQRSKAKVKVQIFPEKNFFIPEFVNLLRKAIPTETQSMVKRVDEQAFAILNGMYPAFVEHIARNLYRSLNANETILDWMAEIEHYESLHSHNAYAKIYKGIQDGLR